MDAMTAESNNRIVWLIDSETLHKVAELVKGSLEASFFPVCLGVTPEGAVQAFDSGTDLTRPCFGWLIEDPETGEIGFAQELEPDFHGTLNVLQIQDLEAIAETLNHLSKLSDTGALLPQVIPLHDKFYSAELTYGYAVDQNGDGGFTFRHAPHDPTVSTPKASEIW